MYGHDVTPIAAAHLVTGEKPWKGRFFYREGCLNLNAV